ncbi:MAG: SH3 domain-containing protein [Deltaproteobacteria bacterium ADurb.Bin510]|nr:MAG: SH3 domain-containing protein [Deltaproteobacteria bacterium ADurb.Bin510]
MRKSSLGLLLALLMLLPSQAVLARGLYIRDWISVPVRLAPADGARELATANSNDLVEILQIKPQWALIRTPAGKVGWVRDRYLTDKMPKALLIEQLGLKVTQQTDAINRLNEENKQLQKENREQKYQISMLSRGVDSARKEVENIKTASSTYLDLKAAYDKLKADGAGRDEKLVRLEDENRRLKTSQRVQFVLLGGLLVIFGFVVGVLLQSLRLRPKKPGFRL